MAPCASWGRSGQVLTDVAARDDVDMNDVAIHAEATG